MTPSHMYLAQFAKQWFHRQTENNFLSTTIALLFNSFEGKAVARKGQREHQNQTKLKSESK